MATASVPLSPRTTAMELVGELDVVELAATTVAAFSVVSLSEHEKDFLDVVVVQMGVFAVSVSLWFNLEASGERDIVEDSSETGASKSVDSEEFAEMTEAASSNVPSG